MWHAIDCNGESQGRVGVVEPEEGHHSVHVYEQHGEIFRRTHRPDASVPRFVGTQAGGLGIR